MCTLVPFPDIFSLISPAVVQGYSGQASLKSMAIFLYLSQITDNALSQGRRLNAFWFKDFSDKIAPYWRGISNEVGCVVETSWNGLRIKKSDWYLWLSFTICRRPCFF